VCVLCVWFGVGGLGLGLGFGCVSGVCLEFVSVFGVLSACGGGMCGAWVLVIEMFFVWVWCVWVCVDMFGLLIAGCVYLCMCVFVHTHTHGGSGTCGCVRAHACVRVRVRAFVTWHTCECISFVYECICVHAHMHACINFFFFAYPIFYCLCAFFGLTHYAHTHARARQVLPSQDSSLFYFYFFCRCSHRRIHLILTQHFQPAPSLRTRMATTGVIPQGSR
jgi:integral membrane sensor domain MASE1